MAGQLDFLIISANNGEPNNIFSNKLRFASKAGVSIAVELSNMKLLTGKIKNYDLQRKVEALKDNGIRRIEKQSQGAPFSTLPPVVIVGHRTLSGANLAPGTYTAIISARLLGLLQTNGVHGGSESEGNGDQANDNTTNLEYILPATGGSGGSAIIVDLDQIPVLSAYTYDNTTYIWTPEDDYPGKANGIPFDWWNNLGFTQHEQAI